MVRAGLGPRWSCLFANDIDPKKAASYARNCGESELRLADVAELTSDDLPGIADLAWTSFPCQDLSLAGSGAGLRGERPGTFWPFWNLRRISSACFMATPQPMLDAVRRREPRCLLHSPYLRAPKCGSLSIRLGSICDLYRHLASCLSGVCAARNQRLPSARLHALDSHARSIRGRRPQLSPVRKRYQAFSARQERLHGASGSVTLGDATRTAGWSRAGYRVVWLPSFGFRRPARMAMGLPSVASSGSSSTRRTQLLRW